MEKKILEGNEAFAKLLGANPFKKYADGEPIEYEMYGVIECIEDGEDEKHFFLPEDMRFHDSWDWIMAVVMRYNNLQDGGLNRLRGQSGFSHQIEDGLLNVNIKDVFEGLQKFVHWYKKQS